MPKKNDTTVEDVPLPPATPDQSFDETSTPVESQEVVEVEPPEAEETPPPRGLPRSVDKKRQEIYDRIRDRKAAESASAGEDTAEPEAAPEEPETAEVTPPESPSAPVEKKFKLKVNHQERELTEAELIAAAQQHMAAEDALPEVKRLRAELVNTIAELRNSGNVYQSAHQPAEAPPAVTTPPEEPEFDPRKIALDIQIGDEDSGAQAIESLIEGVERRILAQQGQQKSSDEIKREVMSEMRTQFAAEAANAAFQGKHPEVYQDRRLAAATVLTLNDLCLQEMRDVVGVSDTDLRRVQETPEHIASWHRQYREQGYPVTDAMQLADAAVYYAKNDLLRLLSPPQSPEPVAQPTPPAPRPGPTRNETRVAEKRIEQNNNNPRRANTISRPGPQAPKTTADIVAEMRSGRRFR